MKTRYIFFILSLIIIQGCKPGKKNVDNSINSGLQTLEIDIDKAGCLKFSEVFSEPVFVPLETNIYSLFSSALQIIVTDSNIFVVPKEPMFSILIFNDRGEFINKIYKAGRGPEEYIAFYYIDINDQKQTILMFDIGNRCFVWMDYYGKFLSRTHVNDFYTNFPLFDFNSGLYVTDISDTKLVRRKEFFHVLIFEPKSKIFNVFLPRKVEGNFMSENRFYRFKGTIYYTPPEMDTIYRIESNHIIPYYYMNFKNHKKPPETFITDDKLKIKDLKKVGTIWYHHDFKEAERFIYSAHEAIGERKWYFHIHYKKIYKSLVFNRIFNDYLGQTSEKDLRFSDFPVELFNETLVFLHEPAQILKNYRNLKNSLTPEQLNNYLNQNPAFARLVNTISEKDNPVLGFYKVRDR